MSNKKNNFILQAGIFAAAGFISRIIGMIYSFPVAAIIGNVGLGYYNSAYNYYNIILLISSYSIPSAISKVISQKLSLKEYRSAHRLFICSLWYVLGVGVVASLLLFFGAHLFVEETAVPVLRVFAPTVFLYGILGVLRGYFQAHKSMVQTSVSQVLEQLANCVVSIGAAAGLVFAMVGTFSLTTDPVLEEKRAVYGAMGSAMGTGAGVFVALIFMIAIYMLNRPLIQKRIRRDPNTYTESYGEIATTIVRVVMPFILSTAAYNLSSTINNKLYTVISIYQKGMDEKLVYANYGIFSGKGMKISNIPLAFASAMAAALIPTISQLVAKRDMRGAKDKIQQAMQTIMILAIPCAVGLFVLAEPVIKLLFPTETNLELSTGVLMTLPLSVVFYAISTLTNSILQGIGRVNTPIINAVIALLLQTVVLIPILMFTDMDVYGLVLVSTLYSGVMCLLNQISIRKTLGYRQEIVCTFIKPTLASLIMGGVAYGVYKGLYAFTSSNLLSLMAAMGLAVVVYFAALILCRGVTESELRAMPKGYLLVKLAKRCRLM